MPPQVEMEQVPGFAIRAKCAGDYTSPGYWLEEDFTDDGEAEEWIQSVLTEGDAENDRAKWLKLAQGGVIRLDAVAVLEIVAGQVERKKKAEWPRTRQKADA